jgi:hypothetical protein
LKNLVDRHGDEVPVSSETCQRQNVLAGKTLVNAVANLLYDARYFIPDHAWRFWSIRIKALPGENIGEVDNVVN